MRQLSDEQVRAFLERYTDKTTSQRLIDLVSAAHNPLLRLPLFLSVLIRMQAHKMPGLEEKLGSRSGLVAYFVKYVLERDLSEKRGEAADPMRLRSDVTALQSLAEKAQTVGQSLGVAEALECVTSATSPAIDAGKSEQQLRNCASEAC